MMAMRTKMILGALLLIVGFIAGWFSSTLKNKYYHYEMKKEINITDDNGKVLWKMPKGAFLVSDLKLNREFDIGWWAYVPVYFGTEGEAEDYVAFTKRELNSILEIKLNADTIGSTKPPS